MEFVLALGLMAVAAAAGYRVGLGAGVRRAEEAAERMRRIDPADRTPGLPTNLGAPPGDSRRVRWRNGQFNMGPRRGDG